MNYWVDSSVLSMSKNILTEVTWAPFSKTEAFNKAFLRETNG